MRFQINKTSRALISIKADIKLISLSGKLSRNKTIVRVYSFAIVLKMAANKYLELIEIMLVILFIKCKYPIRGSLLPGPGVSENMVLFDALSIL